jgi:transcriptional regulator with XRE-family HTH domain
MEPSNLSKLENGNQFPKEENLEKIETVLEVNLKDLFDFEHKQSHKDIKRYITNLLDSLTQTQLEFLYKIIINLKYIK